jgi:hypothetical protein
MLKVVAASPVHSQGAGTDVRLMLASSVVPIGSGPFEAQVVVDGVDHHFSDGTSLSDGLGVFQFALHFNPSVIAVTHLEKGPFLGSTGRTTSCLSRVRPDDHSIFDFACVSQSPPDSGPQGSGTLAILTLTPVGVGASDLTLEGEMGGPLGDTGDDIPVTFSGSSVSVEGTPVPTELQAEASATAAAGTPASSSSATAVSAAAATRTAEQPTRSAGATATARTATPKPGGPSGSDGASDDGGSSSLRVILISVLGGIGIVVVLGSVLYRRGVMAFVARNLPRSRAKGGQ